MVRWEALAPAERRSLQPAPLATPGRKDSMDSIDNLSILADLRERRMLTEAEFKDQKSKVLADHKPRNRGRSFFSLGVVGAAIMSVVAFAGIVAPSAPSKVNIATADATTYAETAGGVSHTWTNYVNAGGTQGPSIAANQAVQISCVVQGFRVADGDTLWYQIASSPWSNGYYVSADAFYNNGQTSGSLQGTPFVDPAVPACGAASPPPPAPAPLPSTSPSSPTTHAETTGGVAHTWTNYTNAGGTQGPDIAANQTVQISCVVQGFRVADGNTSWYQIASTPWNTDYFVSADAFYNNGQTSGSLQGTPFVDPAVPACGGSSTPVTPTPLQPTPSAPSPSSSVQPPAGGGGPVFPVMNTSETLPDGVWFRNSPHTADTSRITGLGVYKGEQVQLNCYAFGDAVGPYSDSLWYYVHNVTRPTVNGMTDAGYLNAHYINDGKATNQIDAAVPACGSTPETPSGPSPSPVIVASAPSPSPTAYLSRIASNAALGLCPGTVTPCTSNEGSVAAGAAVHMVCWENPPSDASHRYFYIQASTGPEGFVHAGAVIQSTQTSTPACSTVSWIDAANWALGQDGANTVPADAKNGNVVTYWSGYCWLFVYDSWGLGAGHTPRYSGFTAAATYNLYKNHGLMSSATGSPPRGSMVFFAYGSAGHVAISLGDGWVETTQGNGGILPVTHMTLSQLGLTQLGFVLPANV